MLSQEEFKDEIADYIDIFIKTALKSLGIEPLDEPTKKYSATCAELIFNLARVTEFRPITPEEDRERSQYLLDHMPAVWPKELDFIDPEKLKERLKRKLDAIKDAFGSDDIAVRAAPGAS